MANGAGASQVCKQAIKMCPDVSATWQKINPLAISPARESKTSSITTQHPEQVLYVYVNTHAIWLEKRRARARTLSYFYFNRLNPRGQYWLSLVLPSGIARALSRSLYSLAHARTPDDQFSSTTAAAAKPYKISIVWFFKGEKLRFCQTQFLRLAHSRVWLLNAVA